MKCINKPMKISYGVKAKNYARELIYLLLKLGQFMSGRFFEAIWYIEPKRGKKQIKTKKIDVSAQGVPKTNHYDSSEWCINLLSYLILDCDIENIWFRGNFSDGKSFFHCLRANGQDTEQGSAFPKKLQEQFENEFPGVSTKQSEYHKGYRIIACIPTSGEEKTSNLDLLMISDHSKHDSNNCAEFTSVRIKYSGESGYTYKITNTWDTGPSEMNEEFNRRVKWKCDDYPQTPMNIASVSMNHENSINYIVTSSIPYGINVPAEIRDLGKNTEIKFEWNLNSGFSHKETKYHHNTFNHKINKEKQNMLIKFPGGEEFLLNYESKFTSLGLNNNHQYNFKHKSFSELNFWLNNGNPINDSKVCYIAKISDEKAVPRWPITISEKKYIETVEQELVRLRAQVEDNVESKILTENINLALNKLREYHKIN